MTDERIWQLIIIKFTGEATPGQLAELEQALKQYPELGFQLDILESVWKNRQGRAPLDAEDSFNRHLQRLSNHLSDDVLKYQAAAEPVHEIPVYQGRKTSYKRIWVLGAIAACFILVFWLVLNSGVEQKPAVSAAQNLVSTKNGSKTKLHLPDGTEVWLNAGSSISYGNDFTGPERLVTLKGEAFFEVAKDSTRPFIIHAGVVDIKVLGTAFNVRSYPDEHVTETALIRGSVEVTMHKNPGKKIVLKPNEKLVVKNDSSLVFTDDKPVEKNDEEIPLMALKPVHYINDGADSASIETMWTKNKLAFDGETLQQVTAKLERWYGVRITIQSDRLKNVQYNGVFDDENIEEVLYALQLTGNFNYTIKKKEVIIKP